MVNGVTSTTVASSPGTHRCQRPPNTRYQSGEGSGGGGFLSFSTSSAYGSQMARAYDGM